ncbi:VOC family protein [Labrys wisconsinensis]|uniref:Catechol 2,3-dioxygenase-like lactoylglutathione lyase family enzyme n=1 Tax=Labrys wisconsinensis TaxID=425677 RepID=A0ABU0JHI7_9HYPH|nr:VOC family protein [Labrys wisconsinensis]MDQ0473751.1 catechol 2,3-dioxygenase-like lactoylglutathione lyase family enzyme [Labrys wisconsinensis]
MLDHVSITVGNLARAERFYDAVFAALGVPKVGRDQRWAGYGLRADAGHPGRAYVSLVVADPPPAPDRRHWAFKAPSRAAVDAFHSAGLAHGGADDGAPAVRTAYHPHYYAAFLVDPDGNRVEAVCHAAAGTPAA